MARRSIAAVEYATPDLIPAHLKKVALVVDHNLVVPRDAIDWDVIVYWPGSVLPPDRLPVGAVLYGPGDTIPGDMLIVGGFNGQGSANPQLNENFLGNAVDTDVWTKNDTESKISVSAGALSFSGGKATPAWNDPRMTGLGFARLTGLSVLWQFDADTQGDAGAVGLSVGTPVDVDTNLVGIGIVNIEAGVIDFIARDGQSVNLRTPHTFAINTVYRLLIICDTTGYGWYVSSDGGATYKIIAHTTIGSGATIRPAITNYNQAFQLPGVVVLMGSVPVPVVNAVSQTVTPSEEPDVVVNGGFDTDTSWSKDPQWSIAAGKATKAAGAIADIYQTVLTVGRWYKETFTLDTVAGGAFNGFLGAPTGSYTTDGTKTFVGRATDLYGGLRAASAATGNVDNVSIVPLTLSSLLGANQTARKEALWDCKVSGLTSGYQAGMWINHDGLSDGTQDAIEVIIDRAAGTFRVSKYVSGTLTNNLISSAVTYAENCVLRAIRVGNSVAFYYAQNGSTFVQVGTTQTISDASIVGQTGLRSISTDSAATMELTCRQGVGVA